MKKWNPVFFVAMLGSLLLIAPFAFAQQIENTIQVLHDTLGEVIDTLENSRYNIFGDISGFTAARIFREKSGEFELHLLRNVESKAQILILDLSAERFWQLQTGIAERINANLQNDVRFDQALYPVKDSKWTESSIHKKLVLHDGSQLLVIFKRAQSDTLIVQTTGGLQISVPDITIAQVIDLRGEIRQGKFYRIDPHGSRLFFAPTGRSLRAGNGYFADYYIFFPTLAFGITDFFSMSGGMSFIPGLWPPLLYFAPKVSLQASSTLGFGIGFMYLAIPYEVGDLNLGYAVTTIGSDRSAITLGAGLPLGQDSGQNPILLIGGEVQISNSAKLISENWIFTDSDKTVVFSGGIRFFSDRLAVDLALISTVEAIGSGGFPFLPWVDFAVFFGN